MRSFPTQLTDHTMNPFRYLIENNILCLKQGLDLLEGINDDIFTHTSPPVYPSSMGDHYRHCLEHYICFLDGFQHKSIDYDARKRDKRIASDRGYAIQATRHIMEQLGNLSSTDEPFKVKMDCRLDAEEGAVWTHSTPERDLQYLQAHTIHHFALIAMIVRLQGYEPGEAFGVAPSTLTYTNQQVQSIQTA